MSRDSHPGHEKFILIQLHLQAPASPQMWLSVMVGWIDVTKENTSICFPCKI